MAGYEWIRRVRQTVPAGTLKTRFGDLSLWIAQGLVAFYAILSLMYPEMRVSLPTMTRLQPPDRSTVPAAQPSLSMNSGVMGC